MVELTVLGYRPATTFVHRLDARFKLTALAAVSLASIDASPWALTLLTLGVAAGLRAARCRVLAMLREMRYFFVLLAAIWVARALSTPGAPLVGTGWFAVTGAGVLGGGLVCWRMLLIVLLGSLLVASTRPDEIRAAVEWFLTPVPLVPHRRVGVMLGLLVRFIPVTLAQFSETAAAQRARGVENRRNPLYRARKLLLPAVSRTFARADRLAMAMEARCYSDRRTAPSFAAGASDWLTLAAAAVLTLAMVML